MYRGNNENASFSPCVAIAVPSGQSTLKGKKERKKEKEIIS